MIRRICNAVWSLASHRNGFLPRGFWKISVKQGHFCDWASGFPPTLGDGRDEGGGGGNCGVSKLLFLKEDLALLRCLQRGAILFPGFQKMFPVVESYERSSEGMRWFQ